MYRNDTKVVRIGDRVIGGGNPILIQSMTNTKTDDVAATVAQIQRLAAAGCDIIRCTVPDLAAARAIAEIKKQTAIPLVADIHFDYKMAVAAIENGADKIRINPGNIGRRLPRLSGQPGSGIYRSVSVSTAVHWRGNWWRSTAASSRRGSWRARLTRCISSRIWTMTIW